MKYLSVFTGSSETEEQLRIFLDTAKSLDDGVPRSMFNNAYYFQVMTIGRNRREDAYPGSQALDDTGGFFKERDGLVYMTEKAKRCVRLPR